MTKTNMVFDDDDENSGAFITMTRKHVFVDETKTTTKIWVTKMNTTKNQH